MVSAGDFRNGITFEMDGEVYQIIEFQHVKPGKGAAFVRTKIRNVIAGSVVERTFNPNEKYPTAFVERKDMEFSYSDEGLYYFMDPESYEMIPVGKDDLGDAFKFVKENDTVKCGDVICEKVGNSGFTNGSTLHQRLTVNGVPVCEYDLWNAGITFKTTDAEAPTAE